MIDSNKERREGATSGKTGFIPSEEETGSAIAKGRRPSSSLHNIVIGLLGFFFPMFPKISGLINIFFSTYDFEEMTTVNDYLYLLMEIILYDAPVYHLFMYKKLGVSTHT
jgi:hypothetical protein